MIKKNWLWCLLTISLFFLSGCVDTVTDGYTLDKGRLLLDKEGTISTTFCEQRNLNNTILVLESKYCSACRIALPKIKKISQELNLEVIYLDLSEDKDSKKMDTFGVLPYYTPTMVVDCQVYVGGKTEEEYRKMMQEFLNQTS